MTYVIAEPCVGTKDASCQAVCPVACIIDVGDHFAIDPNRCVDCGACVSACPVSAVFAADRLPTEWADWTERNRRAAADAAPRGRGGARDREPC